MSDDAVKVAPHVYSVLEENDRVRILEARMVPGVKPEMHSHPAVVAVGLNDGKYRFTSPEGQSMEIEMKAGMAMYMGADEHATENIGTVEGRVILIELK
jgi:hypothetical protein